MSQISEWINVLIPSICPLIRRYVRPRPSEKFQRNVYIYKKIAAGKKYDFFIRKFPGKKYYSECDHEVIV